MLKKIILLISLFFPLISLADILVHNNSDFFGTGKLTLSPCSSSVGDQGIVHPHSTFNVPQSVLNMLCGLKPCQAQVFLSNNCSGKPLASVTLEAKKGVVSYTNMDPMHYRISGGGNDVTLDPIYRGWKDLL